MQLQAAGSEELVGSRDSGWKRLPRGGDVEAKS